MAEEAKWYVVHTYSGYENKVMTTLMQAVESRHLQDRICEVFVPTETVVEVGKDNKQKEVERKLFPGYVFVKMIMSDDAWHDVKNIRGVTGFVGPESKPVALTEEELESMKLEVKPVKIDFEVGDTVSIIDGPLSGYMGKVIELKADKSKVKLSVDLFMGRETEVDVEVYQVKVLD